MRYLYAYDGSGLPLTCKVEFVRWADPEEDEPRVAIVRFPEYEPPLDLHTECYSLAFPGARLVRASALISEGDTVPPASLNWLD